MHLFWTVDLVASLLGSASVPQGMRKKLPLKMLWYVFVEFYNITLVNLDLCHCKQDFIQRKGYPNWTNVTQVLEGAETPLFKQNFSDWLNKDESKGYSLPQG